MSKIKQTIKITGDASIFDFKDDILFNVSRYCNGFFSHKDVYKKLKNKELYFVTIIIDGLNNSLWNNKKYVEKEKIKTISKYRALLFEYFDEEYDCDGGNEVYAKFLEKYREILLKNKSSEDIDDYIIRKELEPRYKEKIMKRYKNIENLKKPRYEIIRKRHYNIPEPLNHIDWRNPYDNIFIWKDKGKKFYTKGGSGGSGQRQTNSIFALGYGLINKERPIKSYLFIYTDDNRLGLVKKFNKLTIPRYDIGSNYLMDYRPIEKMMEGSNFLQWKDFYEASEVEVTSH